MAIITISRGSDSQGKEVAEKVAHRLGFGCISREILLDTSEIFNVPELKLERAIHDAPLLLDRFSCGKEVIPDLEVNVARGDVHIHGKANTLNPEKLSAEIKQRASEIAGVEKIDVVLEPITVFNG